MSQDPSPSPPPPENAPGERPPPRFFASASGLALAYLRRPARPGVELPGLVWLGGFASDMRATKASHIDAYAERTGRAYLRFDYSGHGESPGALKDGCIGDWFAQALEIFCALTQGPQIVVGSSMGGWIACLLARALAQSGQSDRLAGLTLIAPALDFTEKLMWPRLPAAARSAIERDGLYMLPNAYSPKRTPLTAKFFEDGRKWSLLDAPLRLHCPVHILQGKNDPDVPFTHALTIVEHLSADPLVLTLIADGDHRLSRPQDLASLVRAIETLPTD